LEIDNDLKTKAVNDTATAATVAALADENIAGKIVAQTLGMIVDKNGKFSNSSWEKTTWLQWMVQQAIREETTGAIKNQLELMRPQIKSAIEKELSKKSTVNDLVARFVDSAIKSVSYLGQTDVSVNFGIKEED